MTFTALLSQCKFVYKIFREINNNFNLQNFKIVQGMHLEARLVYPNILKNLVRISTHNIYFFKY